MYIHGHVAFHSQLGPEAPRNTSRTDCPQTTATEYVILLVCHEFLGDIRC